MEDQPKPLKAERVSLIGRLREVHAELGRLAASSTPGDLRLVEAHDRIRALAIGFDRRIRDGVVADKPSWPA